MKYINILNEWKNNIKLEKIKLIMKIFCAECSKFPWYPYDYCNIASNWLLKILKSNWVDWELQFSRLEEKDGHTFIMTADWYIIDPTYGQYDKSYIKNWYVWKAFPNKTLQKNISNGEMYMRKQLERYSPKTTWDLLSNLSNN